MLDFIILYVKYHWEQTIYFYYISKMNNCKKCVKTCEKLNDANHYIKYLLLNLYEIYMWEKDIGHLDVYYEVTI